MHGCEVHGIQIWIYRIWNKLGHTTWKMNIYDSKSLDKKLSNFLLHNKRTNLLHSSSNNVPTSTTSSCTLRKPCAKFCQWTSMLHSCQNTLFQSWLNTQWLPLYVFICKRINQLKTSTFTLWCKNVIWIKLQIESLIWFWQW